MAPFYLYAWFCRQMFHSSNIGTTGSYYIFAKYGSIGHKTKIYLKKQTKSIKNQKAKQFYRKGKLSGRMFPKIRF